MGANVNCANTEKMLFKNSGLVIHCSHTGGTNRFHTLLFIRNVLEKINIEPLISGKFVVTVDIMSIFSGKY